MGYGSPGKLVLKTLFAVWLASGLAACGGAHVFTLPAPVSHPPEPTSSGLRAGFGRADITPPPGVPIGVYGPEGRQSTGYRHRIYVRTLALEDRDGERVLFAVADLPNVSLLLHRLVAERLLASDTGIGTDRFMLSATHTHAGPANFYEAKQYNEHGSALPGYDSLIVSFLVDRIHRAALQAVDALQPARVRWGAIRAAGVTRNRSLPAFHRNISQPHGDVSRPAGEVAGMVTVNDTLTMMRVDVCDKNWSSCRPKGAFSVFAIHGTGNPAANDLIDGDIHAIVERRLERHIDSLNGALAHDRPDAVHLLANGAEGDVQPDFDLSTRCERKARYLPGLGPTGNRRPTPPEIWDISDDVLEQCLYEARHELNRLGDAIGDRAIELFDQLIPAEAPLSGRHVERAFTTIRISDLVEDRALCEPRLGKAAAAGSTEDGRTRVENWRPFWLLQLGFTEGGPAAARDAGGCHAEKAVLLGGLQGRIVGKYGFPMAAQFAVVRVGETVLAFLPAEPTTEVGRRIRRTLRASLGSTDSLDRIVVVGLSNGYVHYVSTREEYSVQHYEGGATLYGPQTAAVFIEQLDRLATSLERGKPVAEVLPVDYDPGRHRSYFAGEASGPPAADIVRKFTGVSCEISGFRATWIDLFPGRLVPADGLLLEIQSLAPSGTWETVAWDDGAIEVRALRDRGSTGYEWEARWVGEPGPGREYRVHLLAREGLPELYETAECRSKPSSSPQPGID